MTTTQLSLSWLQANNSEQNQQNQQRHRRRHHTVNPTHFTPSNLGNPKSSYIKAMISNPTPINVPNMESNPTPDNVPNSSMTRVPSSIVLAEPMEEPALNRRSSTDTDSSWGVGKQVLPRCLPRDSIRSSVSAKRRSSIVSEISLDEELEELSLDLPENTPEPEDGRGQPSQHHKEEKDQTNEDSKSSDFNLSDASLNIIIDLKLKLANEQASKDDLLLKLRRIQLEKEELEKELKASKMKMQEETTKKPDPSSPAKSQRRASASTFQSCKDEDLTTALTNEQKTLTTENEKLKREMNHLRSSFRSYVEQNGGGKIDALSSRLLFNSVMIGSNTTGQCPRLQRCPSMKVRKSPEMAPKILRKNSSFTSGGRSRSGEGRVSFDQIRV